MRSLKVPMVVATICVIVAVSGSTAWDGFRMPNLNPFKSRSTSSSSSSGFSLIPKRETPPPPKRPSTLSTWSRNTRRSVASATSWMNPWAKKNRMPATSPPITGSRGFTSSARAEKKEGNWFTNLFKSDEPEPPRVATPRDFVGLDRPRF
ncbi:MAG TPA: hypothetical protein PLI18_20025 [Pirellulaceae bacterium]|nr:hypothetical protein [Pirellulaceae bacterium]